LSFAPLKGHLNQPSLSKLGREIFRRLSFFMRSQFKNATRRKTSAPLLGGRTMIQDPIVEEIHQIREKLSQKFQFDIRKIFKDVKQREIQHPEKLVNLQTKREKPSNDR